MQTTFRFSNISLACLARTVLKNIWMVVAAAMICAMGTSVFYSWFHEDVYQASATFSVVSRKTSYTTSNNSTSYHSTSITFFFFRFCFFLNSFFHFWFFYNFFI